MHWNTSLKETESGEIMFYYTQLAPLKNDIPKPIPEAELSKKIKMLSVSRDYDIDIKTLCYTVVHFEFRHLWQVGIKTIDEVEHFLAGIGSRHRQVLDNGSTEMMYISSFVYDPEGKTVFSETNEKDKSTTCFVAEKTGAYTCRLTVEIYYQPGIIRHLIFNQLERKKKEQELQRSLEQLNKILKEMVVPLEF